MICRDLVHVYIWSGNDCEPGLFPGESKIAVKMDLVITYARVPDFKNLNPTSSTLQQRLELQCREWTPN